MDQLVLRLNTIFAIVSVLLGLTIALLLYIKRYQINSTIFQKGGLLSVGKSPMGIVLGKLPVVNRYVYSPPDQEQHTIVLGGTGLGKTSCILIPSLRTWDGPAFVIDVSGDIHPNVYGRKYVIDPFGRKSSRYNVFAAIDRIDDPSDQDLELMHLGILMMPEEMNDSSAAQYFYKGGLTIIQAALICGYHQGLDFVDICKVVRMNSLEHLFAMFEEDSKANALVASLRGQDPMNLSGCKDKADDALELFALNRYVSACIGREEKSVDPSCLEHSSLYLSIPTKHLTDCEQLMHIISAQVIDYVLSREFMYTNKKRILLCLDELTALGKLDYLIDLLSRSRKNGVRVIVLTQSLADLEMVYPREHRSLIENCGIKVILGAEDLESAQELSGLIGERKTDDSRLERYYRPEQLANLGNDVLILIRGRHLRLRKAPYYKEKDYSKQKIAGLDY